MSPSMTGIRDGRVSFPRVSGDEPVNAQQAQVDITFSPRERG